MYSPLRRQNQAPIFRGLRLWRVSWFSLWTVPKPSPDIQGIKTPLHDQINRRALPKPSPDIQGIKTTGCTTFSLNTLPKPSPDIQGIKTNSAIEPNNSRSQNQAPIFRGLRLWLTLKHVTAMPKPSPETQGIQTYPPQSQACQASNEPWLGLRSPDGKLFNANYRK